MKTISTSIADTAISGVTAPILNLPVLNYDKDYRLKTTKSDNEVIMVNTTAALDEDEQIRIATNEINDIYKASGISVDAMLPSKAGYSLLLQLTKTVKITDPNVTGYCAYAPISVHMVMKFPKTEAVSSTVIMDNVKRLIASLYEEGTVKALGMLKGAISPKGL